VTRLKILLLGAEVAPFTVVRATGGLADTMRPGVTGFAFQSYSSEDFWNSLQEALYILRVDLESWRAMQTRGMSSDFSWESSARAYQQVYERAIAWVRHG
jgi:starch synthase